MSERIASSRPEPAAEGPDVGDLAPRVVFDTEQGPLSLASFQGQVLVVYFYPRAMTPGCTAEACDFRDHHARLVEAGAAVVGVSPDPPERHARFSARYQLPFHLASDGDGQVAAAFGVITEKRVGGVLKRSVERSTFVIDQHGVIRRVWRRVRVPGHVDQVWEFVQTL